MLERHGIEVDPSLELPDCPAPFAKLMLWFGDLNRRRRQAVSGVHPLVWADMDAWARRMRERPTSTEWDLIGQLDDLFRAAAAKHKPKDKPPGR
jgi:hypothetical protein